MKRYFLLMLFFFLTNNAVADNYENPSSGNNLFFKANQYYFKGEFDKALENYELIINRFDFKSLFVSNKCGEVFYNMGNCFYRLGQTGRSILNYERAKMFLPRDADLNYNMSLVKDKVVDDVVIKENIISGIFFWVKSFTVKEIFFVFSFVNFFLFLFFGIRLFYKSEWTFYGLVFFLILWLICAGSLCLKICQIKYDDRVVIIDKEVDVLAGPDYKETLLFKLHEGTIAMFERKEYGFVLIRIQDNKRGWVPLTSTKNISLAQ